MTEEENLARKRLRNAPRKIVTSASAEQKKAVPSSEEESEESTSTLSTSSDEGSESSFADESEAAPSAAKARSPKAKAKARGSPKRLRKAGRSSDSESDDFTKTTCKTKSRSAKEMLVSKVLRRWWYALPDWPPVEYDYGPVLAEKRLKVTELEDWEEAEDIDENGFTKVYEISGFPGVFRDPKGGAVDLRPRENKPCYNVMMEKSELELYELLLKALENQLQKLSDCPYKNTEQDRLDITEGYLKNEIIEAKSAIQKLRRRSC